MIQMFLGLILFFGAHSMQILMPLRARIVGVLGETPYKIAYTLVSLAGIVLLARGYGAWWAKGAPVLYVPPLGLSHLTMLLMLFASVAIVATYFPGHIKQRLKHPMLVAVKLWALSHLLVNGDLPSVVLFGAFLVWAVVDRISVKRRERAGLVRPRDVVARWQADVATVLIGFLVYGLFVWKLHLWLVGVSPLAMVSAV